MNKLMLLAAAAALSVAIAAPAAAQQMVASPGGCAQYYPNGTCQIRATGNRYVGDHQRRGNPYDSNAFWPGEVAADVVGGAIGTAGAIAAAPFGGPAHSWQDESYARRNGFVCTPGTWFRGEDGRPHPCQ
jgi:hypothetical protein